MNLDAGTNEVTCPNCQAIYAVEWHRSPMRDSDDFSCDCGQLLDKWNSTTYPTFTLKERPQG